MKKELKKEFKTNQAIEKLKNLNCEVIDIYEKGYVVYISFKNIDNTKETRTVYDILEDKFVVGSTILRDTNEFCIYNATLLSKNENIYNTEIISINKQIATLKCGICKKEYTQHIKHFINKTSKKCCNECRLKIPSTKRLNEMEVFYDIEENYNLKILPSQKYKEFHCKIGVVDKDGYKGEISYCNIKKGAKISPFAKYNVYALENLKHYIKKNGIDCIVPIQKYNGWDYPMKFQCSCGNIYKTTLTHFIDGQHKCLYCSGSKSNYEVIIEEWLNKNGIGFISQYKFKDCYYKKELPFDFYIKKYNLLIEVDGEGHYEPIRFNGCSKKVAEKKFKDTKKRDKIKDEYCKSHNINLLRISYIDIKNNNYKNILSQIFIKE